MKILQERGKKINQNPEIRICLYCNKSFIIKTGWQIYCSKKCSSYYWVKTHPKCLHCKKPFILNKPFQKFCSKICQRIHWKIRHKSFKKIYNKRYYKKNKEWFQEYFRNYNLIHNDKIRELKYHYHHFKNGKEIQKKWRDKNRDKYNTAQRKNRRKRMGIDIVDKELLYDLSRKTFYKYYGSSEYGHNGYAEDIINDTYIKSYEYLFSAYRSKNKIYHYLSVIKYRLKDVIRNLNYIDKYEGVSLEEEYPNG